MPISFHKRHTYWPQETINEAINLRKQNLSYGDISKRMGITKSTLFTWIGEIKRPGFITKEDQLNHLRNMRKLATAKIKKERADRLMSISEKVKKEVDSYLFFKDQDFLKSMASMLYWAEGAKGRGCVAFANTDPKFSLLFITLLRKSYDLDESKFRVRLHLHYYHKIKQTKQFWSSLLDIPLDKFAKIHIKPRSKTKKFRKNFAGICFILYYSENLRFEILERGYQIADKIAPVA